MKYKTFHDKEHLYFLTLAISGRQSLFLTDEYAMIVLNSLDYLRKNGFNKLFTFIVMPDHVHLLTQNNETDRCICLCDRTLERVRSGRMECLVPQTERTFSNVRSVNNKQYTISDLIQSIKGDFSRKLHKGNI